MAKKLNLHDIIFGVIIIVGLVLAIIGICTFIRFTTKGTMSLTVTVGLFDSSWNTLIRNSQSAIEAGYSLPSRAFSIVAFVVLFIGIIVVIVNAVFGLLSGKNVMLVGICGGVLSIIGGILVLIAGLMLASDFNEIVISKEISAGVGVWFGFMAGIIAGFSGILWNFKNRTKIQDCNN